MKEHFIISKQQLENWLGNGMTRKDLLDLLLELVNGDYCPRMMRSDIMKTSENEIQGEE